MLDYKDYIYAVYRHRNFSKAAQELHVSQPWLSSAIKSPPFPSNALKRSPSCC